MHRPPDLPTPPSPRGKATVRQMLNAGLHAFARYGPQGITIRQLAKAARVNSAAIAYYFGGKKGYYMAVVEYLVREYARPIHQLLETIQPEVARVQNDPKAAANLLVQLLHRYAVTLLLTPNGPAIANIVIREQLNPSPAFEVLYTRIIQPMHETVSKLVAVATDSSPEDPDTVIRAHALIGQVLGFRWAATTICRRLGWERITERRARHIARIIANMTARTVEAMFPSPFNEKDRTGDAYEA